MVVGNDGVGVVGPVALTGGKIFVYIEIGYPRWGNWIIQEWKMLKSRVRT